MTQKEIAEQLSISRPTVTLALAGSDKINIKTRERVQALARRLNYQPNRASRILSTKKSSSVGILLSSLSNPHFGEMSEYLFQKFKKHGYSSIFSIDSDSQSYCELLDDMKSRCVDGIISYYHSLYLEKLLELQQTGVPVLVFNGVPGCGLDFVGVNYFSLGSKAVSHLISCGRSRIAWMGIFEDGRYEGYKVALQKHGIEPDPRLALEINADAESGFLAMEKLLQDNASNLPDGVFCHNDYTAIGAMSAVIKHGLKVPEDIAFVGVDNIRVSQFSNPPITTLSPDQPAIAEKVVDIMIDKITGENKIADHSALFEPKLIIRDSCGYRNREK